MVIGVAIISFLRKQNMIVFKIKLFVNIFTRTHIDYKFYLYIILPSIIYFMQL